MDGFFPRRVSNINAGIFSAQMAISVVAHTVHEPPDSERAPPIQKKAKQNRVGGGTPPENGGFIQKKPHSAGQVGGVPPLGFHTKKVWPGMGVWGTPPLPFWV